MRHIRGIFIHCTATPPDWRKGQSTAAKVAEVKRWHVKERGWSDIGYHYLIDRDGTVATGRPIERDGAHVSGWNNGTIGIALFGGYGGHETDSFGTHYTPDQEGALRDLLKKLKARHGDVWVKGHNEVAAKACPSFDVQRWLSILPITPEPKRANPFAVLIDAILSIFRGAK